MADEKIETKEEAKPDESKGDDGLGDAGKRALDAERRARREAERELKAARDALKEADDAGKSELERLTDKVSTLEKDLGAANAQVLRFEVATAKGLSPAQAKRLVGSTRDELEDDADELRKDLGLDKDDEKEEKPEGESGGETHRKPREDLKEGATPEKDEAPDAKKIADAILADEGF